MVLVLSIVDEFDSKDFQFSLKRNKIITSKYFPKKQFLQLEKLDINLIQWIDIKKKNMTIRKNLDETFKLSVKPNVGRASYWQHSREPI